MKKAHLNIGTCSWKYDSWQGLIYPEQKSCNYLKEYCRHYSTVEVDQWFWSLFPGDKAVLPRPSVIQEYAAAVPDDFIFAIKVPNSITLTHHYKKKKTDTLVPNPHFLSVDLTCRFLERIAPLVKDTGPLMFQFEYLNKEKMPGGWRQFTDLFGDFAARLPGGRTYCVETRNPNYLNQAYFAFLNDQRLCHVFLQGYYMPSVFDVYKTHREWIRDTVVIRLHGPDRKGIAQATGEDWSQIVAPRDSDILSLAEMLADLHSRDVHSFVFVNNHFEGSAPKTIGRIKQALKTALELGPAENER